MSSRSYCFTINNYTDENIKEIEKLECRYCIIGKEIGEKGTPHLQGYIEFDGPVRFNSIKKLLPTAHIEKRKGTRIQAKEYCMKDKNFIEHGDWNKGGQGTRNDLKKIMNDIKNSKPMIEIMEESPHTVSKNLRFIEKYKSLLEKEQTKEFRHVKVEVLYGDAGTGKTREVFKREPKVFTVNTDETFPFDGYDGEEAILLDDYYGGIKYHNLLRILDGHQLRVNVKGSSRYAKWTRIYITSNEAPEKWYTRGLTPALKRRINSVTEFRNEEQGNTMPALRM